MDVESALRAIGTSHGYAELKDKQRDAILAFVSVVVSLPTGYEKSFCLPLLFDTLQSHEFPTSIVVVVTPLAAIMKDQVSDLGCKQITAVQVTSSTFCIAFLSLVSRPRRGGGKAAWYLLHAHARSPPTKPGAPNTTVYFPHFPPV